MENDFNVVLICETKLNDLYWLQFANYDLIKVNRGSRKGSGSTAILDRKNLDYEEIHTHSSRDNKIVEYSIIKLKITTHNLYIVVLYANNNEENHFFIDELENLFVKLNFRAQENFYAIASDFNARLTL